MEEGEIEDDIIEEEETANSTDSFRLKPPPVLGHDPNGYFKGILIKCN